MYINLGKANVLFQREIVREEDTKTCYLGKDASHRGLVPGAHLEHADSEIWFWHFTLYSLDLGTIEPH